MNKNSNTSESSSLDLKGDAFISGKFCKSISGDSFETLNPANGLVLTSIANCDAADVDLAVISARTAFDDGHWKNLPPKERKETMIRFANLIDSNIDKLARVESLETGKPLSNCKSLDIPKSANLIRWHAEAIDKVYGETAPIERNKIGIVTKEPIGVVGAVVAWNFPLYLACYKLGPALITGNSVILKPAEQSSLTALMVAKLAVEAGIPEGVFNVVTGGARVGKAIGMHEDIDCVTFTGSSEVGKLFLSYASQSNMKRVYIEGGGKSPQVVFADAKDLDQVAESIVWGCFYNQGQVCSAGSRLIVEQEIKEQLLIKIKNITESIIVGPPQEDTTQIGCVISEEQLIRIEGYVALGIKEGAEVYFGGNRLFNETGGYYFQPTVFDNVNNSMRIAQEEIFGPILSVITFETKEEAIALANNTKYGLSASVWSQNIDKALSVAKEIRAGQVGINSYDSTDQTVPWCGFKQSGNGVDKSLHAMDHYTVMKTTWIEVH